MSQRDSGHKRLKHDRYETPEWVTDAIVPHLKIDKRTMIHEPAAGSGKMVRALRRHGYRVSSGDITRGRDFLAKVNDYPVIVTNPPYSHAQEFVEHALACTDGHGVVAMLLRVDYDSAKTRAHLFADHPAFAKKIVLTQRIRWIENSTGSPSENHAWFLWRWRNTKPPTIGYAP